MPLNSAQLAALVERARTKAPPVASPAPAPRPVQVRPTKPAPQAPPAVSQPPMRPREPAPLPSESQRPAPVAVPPSEHTAEAEDFPIGWYLDTSSWRFHRRFYAVFRRSMGPGEYSHLLKQIRRGEAEHLGENCWRVTLPDRRTTLPVRASKWTLLTILPKHWQPPPPAAPSSSGSSSSEHVQEPNL